jgi:hypothetical protein
MRLLKRSRSPGPNVQAARSLGFGYIENFTMQSPAAQEVENSDQHPKTLHELHAPLLQTTL